MPPVELFTNQGSTTVSSGGTTAPAPGTTESWTVASSASFPAAVTGTSQFHITEDDITKQSEIILVTNVSGTTWSVTRGVEGTTPVAHTTGFTVVQVLTKNFLDTVHTTAGVGRATSVVSEVAYGLSTVVGTSTLWAPQDHSHGSPATPATSVAGRTGAVTLTAADIGAGTFPAGAYAVGGTTSTLSIDTASTAGGMLLGDGGTAALGPEVKLQGNGNQHWSIRNATGVLQIGNTSGGSTIGLALTSVLALTAGTGAVVTGTLNSTSTLSENGNRVYSAGNAPPYPVTSVAGRTSAVTLTAADIAAGTYPSGTFTYPGSLVVQDLLNVSSVAATDAATGTGVGDKIALYSNTYGIGVQSSRWVAYMPNTASFAVRANAGSGQMSSGSDVFTVAAGSGAVVSLGSVTGTVLIPSGASGATAASRYVGATTSGAPASGTFAVGDYGVGQDASFWVCTTAGTVGSGAVFKDPVMNPPVGIFRCTAGDTWNGTTHITGPSSVASGASPAAWWDTEDKKVTLTHSTSTRADQITIVEAGVYLVCVTVVWAINATGGRYFQVLVNGTSQPAANSVIAPPTTSNSASPSATGLIVLAANDIITVAPIQTSGGALNFTGAKLSLHKVSD
jgi:hypothetical protein